MTRLTHLDPLFHDKTDPIQKFGFNQTFVLFAIQYKYSGAQTKQTQLQQTRVKHRLGIQNKRFNIVGHKYYF